MDGGLWGEPGGIAWLCRLLDEHGGAVEYDLMSRCGMTLADVPQRLGWPALRSFVTHLGPDSAFYAETHPDEAGWYQPWAAQAVLADIYDAVAAIAYGYALCNHKKGSPKPKQPALYPRPWLTDEQRGVRRIGRGAIPVSQFDEWWEG